MKTQYQILRMDVLGTPPVMYGGVPYTYDDPKLAAQQAQVLSRNMGEKLCVKPIINAEWVKREQQRFISGEYRPLPWSSAGWWQTDAAYAIHKLQFPHAAMEKPGYIAYTKSEEDGMKDKQSLLRPGAYLKQYFEKVMDYHGITERRLVEQFMAMYGPLEIKFAATEEDILKVYTHGPQTCLSRDKSYPKDIHPATLYAAGDLQVAYIGDLDGRVSARAVVWPEKKLHSRLYGDIARLSLGLTRLGYKWGPPIGAKIKRVPLAKLSLNGRGRDHACFVAPYIDKRNQQGGGHLAVKDMETHLEICAENTPGSHHCGGADGYSGPYVPREDEYPTYVCERCEDKRRELYTVYCCNADQDGEFEDIQSWCPTCSENAAVRCGYSGELCSEDVEMVQVGGGFWMKHYADMYAKRCEGNGQLYRGNEMRRVFDAEGRDHWYSVVWLRDRPVFESVITGRLHFKSERVTIWKTAFDKYSCSKSELKYHGFQCTECKHNWFIELRNQPFGDDRLVCPTCNYKLQVAKKEQPAKTPIFANSSTGTTGGWTIVENDPF